MLGPSCSSELSDRYYPKNRDPEETEESMILGSEDAASSRVLTEFMMMEVRPCSTSLTACLKRYNYHNPL